MSKMDKFVTWGVINIVWWTVSIILGFGQFNIDVNPFLGNIGEIIFNGAILVVGFAIISAKKENKK